MQCNVIQTVAIVRKLSSYLSLLIALNYNYLIEITDSEHNKLL